MLPSARRRTAALFPIRWLALASTALALAGPVFAAKEAPPVADLTQGGKLEEKFSHDWNLGPTGLRGAMWAWSMITREARQILVTKVDKGSPADGLVQVDDVILGVGTKFTSDARVAFGNAITTAETKAAGGKLPLLLWRKGKELSVTVPLRVMGSYGPQWPYGGCEKSAKIIELGAAHLAGNIKPGIPDQMGALALLATGDKKYLPAITALARKVGPKDLKIDPNDRGMVAWQWGYRNLFLTEYHLATGDMEVLPAIGALSHAIARGQSAVGTWGHGMSWPEDNGGKPHGPLGGYGALNQAGLVCQLSMILAVKCGVKDEEVDKAIVHGTRFFAFYINKGTIPYGDHNPGENHAGNGKNGIAAIKFDTQGHAEGAAFFVALLGFLDCHFLSAAEVRPNIVYILADDLGYGDVQCLNPHRGKIKTPGLDKLASQGMTFTDAHSGSSVCTPTRYGLLTGRYAWRTRLQSGVFDGTDDPPLIAAGRLTVPALLKQQGYTTAALGKWHLGFNSELPADAKTIDPKAVKRMKKESGGKRAPGSLGLPVGSRIIEGPVARGFDYFWGCSNARTMSGLIENERVIENIEPITMLPRLGQRAVGYIAEHAAAAKAGQPFFLYVPLTSPHTPILPTPEWQGKSGLGIYGDFVMQTDAVVGEVLAALEKNGLAGNTLVVFTSDNGCSPAAGTVELERQGHFPSAQFRGSKSDIWDGGHRVPFLVRWPGRIKAGSQCARLICHTDLMATCAEILGAKLPDNADEDSVSILPALLGKDATPLRETVVHHSINGMFAIRQGPWKLELCPGSGGWGKPGDADATAHGLPAVQLYDLGSDIGETKNVQSANPEIVARLTSLLESHFANGRSTPGAKQQSDVKVTFMNKDLTKPKKDAQPAAKEPGN